MLAESEERAAGLQMQLAREEAQQESLLERMLETETELEELGEEAK